VAIGSRPDLELAAAFGASPTNVTVTTSSGTEQWKGFVFEELHDSSGVVDSATFIVAYRDSLVHTMVLSGFRANGTSLGSFLLANDTLGIASNSRTQSVSLTSVGGSCPTPIAGLVSPVISGRRAHDLHVGAIQCRARAGLSRNDWRGRRAHGGVISHDVDRGRAIRRCGNARIAGWARVAAPSQPEGHLLSRRG